ncbi:hypothetical protein [Mesorhizobium sp. M0213]|uniref:hypothetical protein n=1 Tax=Mesorhizobium sp. M0213 TaxID=2956917 RepID=UPI0033353C44
MADDMNFVDIRSTHFSPELLEWRPCGPPKCGAVQRTSRWPARADSPVKGGTLKMGLGGGESTNSLDPALSLSQVPFHVYRAWGEPLLDVNADGTFDLRLAESVESSWRQDLDLQNPERRGISQWQDRDR